MDQNFKTLWFTYVYIVGYTEKPRHYCSPSRRMTATNLSDAKKECLKNPNCHMFDRYINEFAACEKTASVQTGDYFTTWLLEGNKLYT